jgi:1,4-dihydroxy-2-naphthoate octaprenyltransferase
MALLLATVTLGAYFAAGPMVNWSLLTIVLANAFFFLYTAHLSDTFWDLRKGEYEPGRRLHAVRLNDESYLPRWGFGYEIPNAPILPRNHYLAGMVVFSALGLALMVYLSTILGWGYSAIAVGGLVLALTYSAGLDRIPALGDTMWELGVLLAMWCGYYSQALKLDEFIVSVSVPLFISLIAVKALDSLPDTLVDHKTNKVTLTVFLYRKGLSLKTIRHIAYTPLYVAFIILFLTMPPGFKPGALAAIIAFAIQQALLHGDEKGRVSIVVAGFTILAFIAFALLKIAEAIPLG